LLLAILSYLTAPAGLWYGVSYDPNNMATENVDHEYRYFIFERSDLKMDEKIETTDEKIERVDKMMIRSIVAIILCIILLYMHTFW